MKSLLVYIFLIAANSVFAQSSQQLIDTEQGCQIVQFNKEYNGFTFSWDGACLDGKASGNGVLTWQKKKKSYSFRGIMEEGKPARGEMDEGKDKSIGTFKNGTIVEGVKYESSPDDSIKMEGKFESGLLLEGKSVNYFYDSSKWIRIGTFINGVLLEGEGTFIEINRTDTTYFEKGIFKDDVLIKGEARSMEGNILEIMKGRFLGEELDGPGSIEAYFNEERYYYIETIFSQGADKNSGLLVWGKNRYEGTLPYSLNQGYMKAYYQNELIYKGEVLNGQYHGRGHRTYLSGRQHDGYWERGIPEGLGHTILPDGSEYFGEFSNDRYDGYGIMINSDGSVSGKWKKGKLIEVISKEETLMSLQQNHAGIINDFNLSILD